MFHWTGDVEYVKKSANITDFTEVILCLRKEVSQLEAFLQSGWICDCLQHQVSGEELEKIQAYMQAESWASPAFRRRNGSVEEESRIPLRFHLEIDLKM